MHPQFQRIKRVGIASAICLALASCAIPTAPTREDLQQQALAELKFPAKWQHSQSAGEFDAAALGFSLPPDLLALIAEAQRNNPDLRLAALRVEQSQSAVKAAGAALLPSLALGGQGGESAIPTSSMAINGLALIAQWEIDIWGKTRSGQAAAREQNVAAELDTLYARQSIAAAVVKAWLSATEATQQIRLAQEMVKLSEQQLGLIQTGQKIGRNTQQEVLLNQLAVKNYRAQLSQSQQALNNSQRALEVLIGRYPAAEIAVASALPAEPTAIPAGLPSQLAERRPDLRAAESRFRAAFFNVEVAKKAYLPTISLTAGLGVADNQLFKLQEDLNNPIWGVTGKFLAPIFTAGLIDAQVEIKTAQQQEASVQYAKAMLNALNEIEGGLNAEQKLAERYQLLKGQVSDQQKLIALQKVQIKVGKGDNYQLYQQQLALANYQFSLLRLQNERLIQRVNLHLALGGMYPM